MIVSPRLLGRLGLVLLASFAVISAATAEEKHSSGSPITARDLKRSYGFTCLGAAPPLFTPPGTPPIPFAELGQVTCDGKDTCTGTGYVASGPGEPLLTYVTGQFTLQSNGIGQITYGVSLSPDADPLFFLPITFVVMDNGREIRGLPTLGGNAVICELKEQ